MSQIFLWAIFFDLCAASVLVRVGFVCPFCVCAHTRVCVCLSTGRGESTAATGARCDDRRSLDLKIVYCSQHRETEDKRERAERGGNIGENEVEVERKARSLRITSQSSRGKVSSPPDGTAASFSMKSLICSVSQWCHEEGSDGEGADEGAKGVTQCRKVRSGG